MAKPENRSQLMEYFGADQRNTVWSWCAVNENERKVYFSVWTDSREKLPGETKPCYVLQEPDWGIGANGSRSPARNDHDEKLSLVFDKAFEAFGYFIEPKDKTSIPREIAHTKTSFVFRLELKQLDDGRIVGYPLERIDVH